MKYKFLFFLFFGFATASSCLGQIRDLDTLRLDKIKKVTIINPGVELSIPYSKMTSLNIHLGIGYGGSYPNLTEGFNSGGTALISPFLDIQYRLYTNRNKKYQKGKNIKNNSGSFIALRGLIRGKEIASSFERTSDIDFGLGLAYGFQKYKSRFGWSFTIAPYVYFDDKGNIGFFPLIPEINIGYILGK